MAAVQKSPLSNPSGPHPEHRFSPSRLGLVLLAATALLYGVRLGQLDFWAPDEPRYGAIAEELRTFRHDKAGLVLLHLNDAPYTQKPPLYFWLAALAGVPGDRVTEGAARLPSALAGVASVALTLFIARRFLADPRLALVAAGLLATSVRFAFTARRAQLDVLLTCFELMAIALFVSWEFTPRRSAAHREPDGARHRIAPTTCAIAGFHAALGAAALVKGPVGWLPLAVIAAYWAWEGRLRSFRTIAPAWAWGLSIAPLVLWISGAIWLAPAGFAEVAVTDNLIGRFFSGTSHARPFYYYLYQTPGDFLPWTLLLPFGLPLVWRLRNETKASSLSAAGPGSRAIARFVLAWAAVPLALFSLSAGKRGVYLLPVFPALAIIAAIGAAHFTKPDRDTGAVARRIGFAIAIIASIEFALFVFAAPLIDDEKSPRPIAEAVARHTPTDEALGVYGLEPIEGAIGYYGHRSVSSFNDPKGLRAFIGAGGRFILMRARHFEQFEEAVGLEEVEAFRSDRRKLVLVRVAP